MLELRANLEYNSFVRRGQCNEYANVHFDILRLCWLLMATLLLTKRKFHMSISQSMLYASKTFDINRCRKFTSSSPLMSYAHICWDEAVIIYWQNTDCQRMAAIILCQNWFKQSGISLQSVEQLLISWSWKMAIIYLKISINELCSYMLR